MPSRKKKIETISDDVEAERLKKWREKRQQVALSSQQERTKQAEAERRKRLEAFEIDKQRRIKEAAENRAQEEAAKVAERMNTARAKIANRTDVEAARKRLMAFRRKTLRALGLRVCATVVLPTLLVGVYLFSIQTPVYVSHSKFALEPLWSVHTQQTTSPFSSNSLSRDANQVKEVILSPQMLRVLNEKSDFETHFQSAKLDPITRARSDLNGILKHNVSISVNGQDGIVHLKVQATDMASAQDFAQTIQDYALGWLADKKELSGADRSKVATMITPPTPATKTRALSQISTLMFAGCFFASMFVMVSIFMRTLGRHAQH